MPPTLRTTRLSLRRPGLHDTDAIFAFASDPETTRLMEWPTHIDGDDSREFLQAVDAGWDGGEDYCWVLVHAADARVIGTVAVSFDEHGAEIGYILARAYWGLGLATEAARAIFDSVLQIEDIYRVWATCDIDNTASARVLEKIGLHYEARLARWSQRPNYDDDPCPRDVFMYAWIR